MIKTYERHSPSKLNLYASCPSMFVVEQILGIRQPVGAIAHRGSAVEEGVSVMLKGGTLAQGVNAANAKYDLLTVLSGDARKDRFREDIPSMVERGFSELEGYGPPDDVQGFVTWKPPELRMPIVGYFDFRWNETGMIVDLKTTDRMPSEVRIPHARQVSLYTELNLRGVLCYVTPKKSQLMELQDAAEHRNALMRIAKNVENFLALSDDPQFYLSIISPDLDSFYWSNPAARALAYDVWGI